MKAYELEPPAEASPRVAMGTVAATRRRQGLSIRERRVVLAGADFLIGAVACYTAFIAIRHPHLTQLEFYDPLVVGAFWVVSLLIADGYAFQIPSSRAESGFAVIKALPVAALLTVLVFFLHPYVLTRPVIVASLGLGAAMLIAFRITAARLLLHESLATRAVLLSDTEPSAEIVNALRAARFEYRVVDTLITGSSSGSAADSLVAQLRDLLEKTG